MEQSIQIRLVLVVGTLLMFWYLLGHAEGQTCRDDYEKLASTLINTSDNKYQLSIAFFPTERAPPTFVKVIYVYDDTNVTNDTSIANETNSANKTSITNETWFWSAGAFYFFQPLQVYQFTSLLFGNPAEFRSGNVTLILPADCANAQTPIMETLTQRLKLIASSQRAYPVITDRYQAKATSMNTVNESFYYHDGRDIVTMIHIVQVIFPLVCSALILGFYGYYWKVVCSVEYDDIGPREWSTVAAYYLVSLYFTFFVFCLDCAAVDFGRVKTEFIINIDNIKYLTIAPLIYDLLAVIFIVAVLVISSKCCRSSCCSNVVYTKWQLICLGLAGFPPLLCIASHAHFIVIAWITAPNYAYGIGVFYTILLFVYFFTFKVLYYICARYGCHCCEQSEDQKFSYVVLILPLLLGVLLTGFFVMIACFVVLIPITESIEDASKEVSVIYQGIIFVLTALLAYIVIKPIHLARSL